MISNSFDRLYQEKLEARLAALLKGIPDRSPVLMRDNALLKPEGAGCYRTLPAKADE